MSSNVAETFLEWMLDSHSLKLRREWESRRSEAGDIPLQLMRRER